MPSRRYIIHIAPVAHMNGKMTQAADIVHNQPDTDQSDTQYYYGYRVGDRQISRYALRVHARNLSNNPYTANETANKQYFKACIDAVDAALQNESKRALAFAAFRKQKKYVLLRNYCIAMTSRNGGVFPW